MDEILSEFKSESESLVREMIDALEEAEESYENRQLLEKSGQIVDRIMGGAKTIAMTEDNPLVQTIGSYAELCKAVSYKGSQIQENEEFYNVVVALLLDSAEYLEKLIDRVGETTTVDIQAELSDTFLDRLRWIGDQFGEGVRGTLAMSDEGVQEETSENKKDQKAIDDLLKQLGVS